MSLRIPKETEPVTDTPRRANRDPSHHASIPVALANETVFEPRRTATLRPSLEWMGVEVKTPSLRERPISNPPRAKGRGDLAFVPAMESPAKAGQTVRREGWRDRLVPVFRERRRYKISTPLDERVSEAIITVAKARKKADAKHLFVGRTRPRIETNGGDHEREKTSQDLWSASGITENTRLDEVVSRGLLRNRVHGEHAAP